MSEGFKLNQEQNETVKAIIQENVKKLHEIIRLFGEAPEGHLDADYAQECKDFAGSDPVFFLRNLQDKVVHASKGSDFVVKAITASLIHFPEEKAEESSLRRANLASEMGISSTQVAPAPNGPQPTAEELEEFKELTKSI